MGFCKNCGASITNEQTFCKNCGQLLKKSATNTNQSDQLPLQHAFIKRKKMSKRNKFALSSVVIILALLIGTHLFLQSYYSSEKAIQDFREMVATKDSEKAKEIFDLTDIPQVKDKSVIEKYLLFLNQDLDHIVQELELQAESYENGQLSTSLISDSNGSHLFTFRKDKKLLGLYQTYTFKAIPYELSVDSNFDDIDIILDGKTIQLHDGESLSGLLPGNRKMKVSYNGEYLKLDEEVDLDFTRAEDNQLSVEVPFDSHYVYIDSNKEDSTLFVNGKSTGEKVGSYREFGPIPTDGSITLHAEYQTNDGIMKSKEIKIMNTDHVYLMFTEEENPAEEVTAAAAKDSLEEFIGDYISTSVEAMNAGDFSIVEPLIHPKGKAYAESEEYINYVYSKKITEDVVSTKVISIEEDGDNYLLHTQDVFDIHYSDGTTNRKKFASVYKVINESNKYRVWSLESTDEIE